MRALGSSKENGHITSAGFKTIIVKDVKQEMNSLAKDMASDTVYKHTTCERSYKTNWRKI